MATDSFTFAATGDAIIAHPVVRNGHGRDPTLTEVLRDADAAVTQVEPVVVDAEAAHDSFRQVSDRTGTSP